MTEERYVSLGHIHIIIQPASKLSAMKRFPNVGRRNNNGFLPLSEMLIFTESNYCHQCAPLVDKDMHSCELTQPLDEANKLFSSIYIYIYKSLIFIKREKTQPG